MLLQESGEMYIETIYVLSQKSSHVRAVDVGEKMGFSKPSVSRAMGLLKDGGYVTVDSRGAITLTEKGLDVAEKMYERHQIIASLLIRLGVDPEVATEDSCKIEHVISDETFSKIKDFNNPLFRIPFLPRFEAFFFTLAAIYSKRLSLSLFQVF